MAWPTDQPGVTPAYSTLEVSRRQEFSTLEVDPRPDHSTLEVKETDPDHHAVITEPTQTADGKQKSWWRRYWILILVLGVVVVGGILGGTVGGSLAEKDKANRSESAESATASSATTSSVKVTTTSTRTSSHTSTSSVTTSTTTMTFPSTKPTRTPGPNEIPRFPVYIGDGDDDGDKFRLAFVDDGSSNAGCKYGVIPASVDTNPCGHPFLLPDGFEYVWNGCGGDTWVTWMNPSSYDTEYRKLHEGSCVFEERRFNCDGVVVTGAWLCRNNTE